jgi:hypothetical protein
MTALRLSVYVHRNTNSLYGIHRQRKLITGWMCKHANLLSLIKWRSAERVAYVTLQLFVVTVTLRTCIGQMTGLCLCCNPDYPDWCLLGVIRFLWRNYAVIRVIHGRYLPCSFQFIIH